MTMRRDRKRRWIQGSMKHKGSLKRYLSHKYGNKAFTKRGTIKSVYLHRIADDDSETLHRRRQANLVLTLRESKR